MVLTLILTEERVARGLTVRQMFAERGVMGESCDEAVRSLPQLVKFLGWKIHGRAFKQCIFSPITSIFDARHFDENHFTYQCEKEDKKA